jgi:DNA-binding transcriptional ArsR family regulator
MGHPGRRAMLRLARHEERSASELAEAAGLSPSAASPHLKLLREVGFMHVPADAKRRLYKVDLGRVYALLTDAELLVDWLAPLAHADPVPGGARNQPA